MVFSHSLRHRVGFASRHTSRGDSLWRSASMNTCVEPRPSYDPISSTDENPRGTLMAVAFSQTVDCRVDAAGRGLCALSDGRSVGGLLKTRAAWAAGREWR